MVKDADADAESDSALLNCRVAPTQDGLLSTDILFNKTEQIKLLQPDATAAEHLLQYKSQVQTQTPKQKTNKKINMISEDKKLLYFCMMSNKGLQARIVLQEVV